MVLDLITVKFLMSYSTKPMQIFGKVGALALFLGGVAGAITVFEKIAWNLGVNRNGWALICMLFLLAGMQFISMGLLGEISIRAYYESQQKPIYTIRERIETKPGARAKKSAAPKRKKKAGEGTGKGK